MEPDDACFEVLTLSASLFFVAFAFSFFSAAEAAAAAFFSALALAAPSALAAAAAFTACSPAKATTNQQ